MYLTIMESDQTGPQFAQAALKNFQRLHFSHKTTVRAHVIFWIAQKLRSGFKILYYIVGHLMII